MARDPRSHLLKFISEDAHDHGLWQPLDKEQGSLELTILRVRTRPDCQLSIYPSFRYIRN